MTAEVRVDRDVDGTVVVRQGGPGGASRRSILAVAAICAALCLVPVAVALFTSGRPLPRAAAVAFAALFTVPLATRLARQFTAGTAAWLLRAGRGELTVEATDYRGRTVRHFARGQVADVTLDGSGGPDPHRAVFRSMLVIRPTTGRPIRCLHNAGGDQLARAANALRAALGLPPRSWP